MSSGDAKEARELTPQNDHFLQSKGGPLDWEVTSKKCQITDFAASMRSLSGLKRFPGPDLPKSHTRRRKFGGGVKVQNYENDLSGSSRLTRAMGYYLQKSVKILVFRSAQSVCF